MAKPYFIVFNRDPSRKKEIQYNVNFFYLRSIKGKKFSFVNDPFFKGTVVFGLDLKSKMRPLQFTKIHKDGTFSPLDPKLFRNFLLSNMNSFIAFSSQANSEDIAPIKEMLENFQFDVNKIRELTFCSFCLEKRSFTILNKGYQIKSLKDQFLCPDCALDVVIKQASLSGLVSEKKLSPKLKNFFKHMVLKFKNLNKVISTLQADFNPVKNAEITLYDVEKPPSISKRYLNYKIEDIKLRPAHEKILKNLGLTKLLPIQAKAIESGLIDERVSQLIMAPTSAGKTLIGELAGISRVLQDKKKMLYMVPIVALANIRADEFKKKYSPLKLKIVKKIGESLLDDVKSSIFEDISNADVIIGTYEALDHVLRSGNKDIIGDVGTIIIDEIQVLIDPERGFLVDGFISRLKTLFPSAQYLYLSATIGEPKILANKLGSQLIQYGNRPVPLERHLILCLNENKKHRYISQLVKNSYWKKSKFGFKGQSIVFTNARKKCESLTSYLHNRGLRLRAYHGGLTSRERKVIEKEFQQQKIAGVVTTAALAAGVDLPASQVIFESLAMGINWLSVAEFEQMLGRAGRLNKHEKGLVYVLVEPGKTYSPKMKITEENIGIKLLNGKIKDFELVPDGNREITELLAFISMFNDGIDKSEIIKFYSYLINANYELDVSLKKLIQLRLLRLTPNSLYKPKGIGQAIAKSFLTLDVALEIIEKIKQGEQALIDIVLDLKPLRNVYISKSIVADLSKNVNMKYFSNNFFSANVLSLMNAESVKKKRGSYSKDVIDLMQLWTREIFNCKCQDNPYCECGKLNLLKILLSLRIEDKMTIEQIHVFLEENYKLLIFKGDLIDYFENLIYSLESLKNMTQGLNRLDPRYQLEVREIPKMIEKIKSIAK